MCSIVEFEPEYQEKVWKFLEKCLPESGRTFDLSGRHREYLDIGNSYEKFWCLFDGEAITGTVALKRMNDTEIELKSLYLLEKYHGRGLGRQLLGKRNIKQYFSIRSHPAKRRSDCTEKPDLS